MSNNQLQDYSIESSNLKAKRRPSENSSGYSSGGGWRKYSGQSKNSYDSSYKGSGKKYRRERFNSEGNSKWGNNHYNFGFKSQTEEIEIDVSKIKYSLNLNYKYPLDSIQSLYNKMKQNKKFEIKPKFFKEEEIVGEKPKEIVIFGSTNNEMKPISNVSIKLPKTNPLSTMSKAFNKFDMIPQNMPTAPNVEKDTITKVEDSKDLNNKE